MTYALAVEFAILRAPKNAIELTFNKYKEYQPIINPKACTNCGVLHQRFVLHPQKNINNRFGNLKLKGINTGTDKAVAFFRGFEKDKQSYEDSSSGGLLTALLKHLLSENIIDAVVHAQMNYGDQENAYFSSCISRTLEELDSRRSSFYYPIEFSSVLKKIKADDSLKKVAILGVPCALSGIHYLLKKDIQLRQKIKYSFSLVCSHNTNGQFANNLRQSIQSGDEAAKIKFRDKKKHERSAQLQ